MACVRHSNGWRSVSNLALICLFLLVLPQSLTGQQYELRGGFTVQGFLNNGENPFWDYSNTLGMISSETAVLGVLDGYYRTYLTEDSDLEVGATAFTDLYSGGKNNLRFNEYFASYKWRNFRATAGARARPERYFGISSVNGDIIWSNNARPMPGMEVGTVTPWQVLPWLGIEGSLAHFWLENDRFVTGAYVHYKYLTLNFNLSESSLLRIGLQHYAQWGGISPESGSQPAGFGDYWKVFFGQRGDEGFQDDGDQLALGNHVGSYQIEYRHKFYDGSISGYYQTLIEDSSGASLQNLADGVFGVFWELPERSAIRGLIYEYVQTTVQSGPPGSRNGEDDYFNHGVYENGWTYKERVIGLPYFTTISDFSVLPRGDAIINNRVTAHHLGARVSSFDENWDFRFMASIVKNRGRYKEPFDPVDNALYSHARIRRLINDNMQIGFTIGSDISRTSPDNFAVSLSFKYLLGETLRIVPEELQQ